MHWTQGATLASRRCEFRGHGRHPLASRNGPKGSQGAKRTLSDEDRHAQSGMKGLPARCLYACPNVNVQSHASTAQRLMRSHLDDLPAHSFTQRRRAGAIPSRFPVVLVAMPCTKRTPDAMLLCTAPGAFIFGIPLTASRLPRTPSSRRHRATGSARRRRAMFPR